MEVSAKGIRVVLEGLTPFTRYAMLVQAYNSKGTGPSSPAVTTTTNEDSEYMHSMYSHAAKNILTVRHKICY